jgi:hypothetical protein
VPRLPQHKVGRAAQGLHDVVIGRRVSIRPAVTEAVQADEDQA